MKRKLQLRLKMNCVHPAHLPSLCLNAMRLKTMRLVQYSNHPNFTTARVSQIIAGRRASMKLVSLLSERFVSLEMSKAINLFPELSVLLPEHVRTPKHLRVIVDHSSVKVIDQSNQVVILDETLARKWKASEAVWSVVAGKKLQITVGMFVYCGIGI